MNTRYTSKKTKYFSIMLKDKKVVPLCENDCKNETVHSKNTFPRDMHKFNQNLIILCTLSEFYNGHLFLSLLSLVQDSVKFVVAVRIICL